RVFMTLYRVEVTLLTASAEDPGWRGNRPVLRQINMNTIPASAPFPEPDNPEIGELAREVGEPLGRVQARLQKRSISRGLLRGGKCGERPHRLCAAPGQARAA